MIPVAIALTVTLIAIVTGIFHLGTIAIVKNPARNAIIAGGCYVLAVVSLAYALNAAA